jgi:hypothetical protein
MICRSKIIVFDLDETLGYFTQLGIFWDTLREYAKEYNLNINMEQEFFNKLLDLYPEFIRPNIVYVLNYLKEKKEINSCKKLLIYTNNQGPKEWANNIKDYFEEKIKYKLFDQIIGAFQKNGKRIEICRTSNLKSKRDLINCSKIPEDSKICIIDDTYYPEMTDDNIYYINLKPYIYDLPFKTMVDRFINKRLIEINNIEETKRYLLENMNRYNYIYIKKNKIEYDIDKTLTKKLYELLLKFFNDIKRPLSKSKKEKLKTMNKTKKLRK